MLQRERIIVLGGLGFMGSHICRELVRRGHSVRIFDKLYASQELIDDFRTAVEVVEGDVSRPEDVLAAIADANIVINLIHTTVPGSSMNNPSYDVTSNVAAAANWLQHLGETKVRKVFYLSSGGTVYGVPEVVPIAEDHPTNPVNSYGITKLAIEKYTAMYAGRVGIDYFLLRPSNIYGPDQHLNIGQGLIGVLANRALGGEHLEIWGTGENLRDYLFIDDLVAGLMTLLSYQGPDRVFNLSSGQGHSILDIVSILRGKIDSFPEVVHLADRGFDVPVNVLDSSRMARETGWQPRVDLESGIERTINWIKSLGAK
jgi:UDP-glucose 4-epimerase